MQEIKVIGIGGIGCALLPHLARYLRAGGEPARVTLVDGDAFEPRNADRQAFSESGNKAKVKAVEMARQFEGLSFRAMPEYVTPENVGRIIRSGDVVFLGVDNHKTRRLVSDHCQVLGDVVLISGGNDYTDGNVQVYLRRAGRDVTLPLTRYHPEIADPKDRSPHEMSCDELAREAAPQLLFTNLAVASAMLIAFYACRLGKLQYGEVYLDILEGKTNPIARPPTPEPPDLST
ncbi:MAG: ThiF family adenylyltransferase [candidate division NC10 bacterium]|nr:ThiF family adenylyltransferase [candidate division NC10 bacterium]